MSFINTFNELDLDIHGVRLPSFSIENKYKRQLKSSEDISNEEFLEALCKAGLEKIKSQF